MRGQVLVTFRKTMIALLLIAGYVAHGQVIAQPQSNSEVRIQKETRHRLLTLPYIGAFDNITFRVTGNTVTLAGQVTRPTLRSDAANTVKRIEGVEVVNNQIEVLPVSPFDDQLRRKLFRSIYGDPALQRYSLGPNKPIRIIVRKGNVHLEGFVDRVADRNIAGIRANEVPGVFKVDNNLQIAR
jgi:hyperosmotically inducible protein